MAFFKLRKGGDESASIRPPAESIEAMRRRARHRLIGAGVLVLIGVVGFPLLFDTQPRPISVDIPIEIPDRNKAKPLAVPAQPAVQAPVVSGPVTAVAPAPPEKPQVEAEKTVAPPKVAATPAAPASASAGAKAVAEKNESNPQPKPDPKPDPKPEPKPEPKAEPKAEPKVAAAAPKGDDGAKAQALLEGKPVQVAATEAEGRFVVQVGAFADPAKARETRLKVERAGLKTYTHVAETKEGKRIRVRVGPFGTRAEADKAAEKLKGLDLPAAILTL